MTDLSPAAQAISDAYENNLSSYIETGLIAALRELADQVVPKGGNFIAARIRAKILAIATELEGTND